MKIVYVDSSVWIIRVEGSKTYKQIINDSLETIADKGAEFCVSELVLLEVMVKLYKKKQPGLIRAYNKIFEQTRILKNYPDVFDNALQIAQSENLKGMDAIHVSIADHYGCDCFISPDSHFKKLKVIQPIWIDINKKGDK